MSFLGFERSLLFLPTSLRRIFLRRVFLGLMAFSVFHQFSCFSRRFLFIYMGGGLFYGFSWLWRSFLTRDMHQSCSRRRLSCWKLLSSVCFCFCFWSRLEHEGGSLYLIVCLRGDKIAAHNGWKSFNMLIGCLVCVVLFYSLPHQFGFWNGTTTLLGPPLRK